MYRWVGRKVIDELALIKLHPETASTKQKIIDLLSNEYPLPAKSIHSRLQRLYSTEISYQGVHKLLKEMEDHKIIERKKQEYLLSIEWIQKSKKTLENVEKKYLQNQKIVIPEDFAGSIEIEFDSLTDLAVSTAELLMSRQLVRNSDDQSFICTFEYGWWTFKFKFEHLKLLLEMAKANPKPKNIIRNKTPFGKWIREQYGKVGGIGAPIGTKVDIDEELFVQGDCLIEVKYSEETKKIIEHYFNKWKSLDDSFKEFGLKPEPKTHSVMRITRNPEMANFWRNHLTKVLKESLKAKKK
ncbi:hypothetical protein KKG83_03800 [Candidatus Micrarchaeota archaeon]|nr:hypothetical protein [Candidatus Micrarchaeota archaeon]MBU2476569.1 hypothetical protein [Candidatus Micrarchaeota archaeon]